MSEPISVSTEKTVVVEHRGHGALWALTTASLALNGLILLLLVVGAIIHHHERHREFGGPWRQEGRPFMHGMDGGRNGFNQDSHRFGGQAGKNGPMGQRDEFAGRDNDRDPEPRGFGPPRMMAGGPPDAAKMSDHILDFLTDKLALTNDEKAKLKPVIDDQVAQFQKTMEAQHEAMQKQIEDAKSKIKPLLNADQQKELDALPLPGDKAGA